MKSQLKLLSAILILSTLLYTACKKTSSAPTDPQLTPTQVAGQVATTISQSLTGDLGVVDVSEGLNGASTFALHTKGKTIYDIGNPQCGQIVDTTVTFNFTSGDTSLTETGAIKFSFGCTGGVLSSYTTDDSVNLGFALGSTKLTYSVSEDFTLTALTPTSQTSNLSITGTLGSNGKYSSSQGSGTMVFNYTLTSIVFTGDGSGTILSGSATFNTSGTGPRGAWNYAGTITLNGSGSAVVTINGKTYTVNLLTGATS